MGTYISQSDIVPGLLTEEQLVQLTQDDVDADEVDSDVVTAVIAEAEAEVDGYLGARYALPLDSTPQIVKSLAARVTRYRLHTRRPGSIADWLQRDYDTATRLLEKISTGVVTLGVQPEADPNSERVVKTNGQTRTLSRDDLEDF